MAADSPGVQPVRLGLAATEGSGESRAWSHRASGEAKRERNQPDGYPSRGSAVGPTQAYQARLGRGQEGVPATAKRTVG